MLEIFTAMGMSVGTVSTADKPRRFMRAIFDATSGYEGDEKLVTALPTECRGGPECRISQMVEGRSRSSPCASTTTCVLRQGLRRLHRARAHPGLTRLVRLFARRFIVQERIGQRLADALDRILQPHGVAVHLEAVHLCTQKRGVREIESSTRTAGHPVLHAGRSS